ncbi:hypothetical protein ACVIIW_002484 [Bradyrhizobium sp. USDA 4449]
MAHEAGLGAAKPPAWLAIDVLQDDHIGVDDGLVAAAELLGRQFVQQGRESATIVAERFCISISVISPKKPPGFRTEIGIALPAFDRLLAASRADLTPT